MKEIAELVGAGLIAVGLALIYGPGEALICLGITAILWSWTRPAPPGPPTAPPRGPELPGRTI